MPQRVAIESFHPHELELLKFGGDGTGPSVFIAAGLHGGEGTGIWVARSLADWLSGRPLKGQVTVLPVANPAAFRKLTRFSPYDELDLNRIFPGRPSGTPSVIIAHTIFEEARSADFVIDLHCCGLFGSNYTLALWQEFASARDLAARIDIPVVIESSGVRGQLFTELSHLGIPAAIIELAGGQFGSDGGVVDRSAGAECLGALQQMLIRLGVIEGTVPPARVRFFDKLRDVTSLKAALWTPAVVPGAMVSEGDVLGHLDSETVLSPVTGVATGVKSDCYVFQGHTVVMVAPAVP